MLLNAGRIEATGGDFLFYREGVTEAWAGGRRHRCRTARRRSRACVPARPFLEMFHGAGLTTRAAMESGSIARACRESTPNETLRSPPSLDHRYVHEDVGYGLVPIAALAGWRESRRRSSTATSRCSRPPRASTTRRRGFTLERMGIAGLEPAALSRLVLEEEA